MSGFTLKQYQERALDALRDYLVSAREHGARTAFVLQTNSAYTDVEALPGLPYVCLRIPTGGGKTVMACHAVSIASRELLRQERSVVLWLVPTNVIKDQTLAALRNRHHPYRQALDATLDGRVAVMDLAEALSVQRSTLDGQTTIIVSTLAAFRVEDTDGRKVYEQNGSLMSHLSGLPDGLPVTLDTYEGTAEPIPSLANVLRLRRPIVIVDEAHNARTSLSFETLARFAPSCILEFTATPAQPPNPSPSNVLYHVSALELKSEGMIKLPVRLETCPEWKEAVIAAIEKQKELEEAAVNEKAATGEAIRPIVLLQAQKKNEDVPVETLEAFLKADCHIPADQIAVEAYDRHGLDGVDILSPDCPVRFVITVDKLKEGWDCPFAYVLASIRDLHSATAIEQILGRVLRMPRAERKETEALNLAYAFARSPRFMDVVGTFYSALESNGFGRYEARVSVTGGQTAFAGQGWAGTPLGQAAQGETAPLCPAARGEVFEVPQLALRFDGSLEPLDDSYFLTDTWDPPLDAASLTEAEFSLPKLVRAGADVDVSEAGNLTIQEFTHEVQEQLALLAPPPDIKTEAELAVWLDRNIRHPDIKQAGSSRFMLSAVQHLTQVRHIALEDLSRRRLLLRDAVDAKIDACRRAVRAAAFRQLTLIDTPAESTLEVDPECVFAYDPNDYPANDTYAGPYVFRNHYYDAIGTMNGEEELCACTIDALPQIHFWVRNLERQERWSFWLQTATDKFYPDFVCKLIDGRVLAVEYKGADRMTNDDTNEKRAIGELWATRSNGHCLFALVGVHDYQQRLREIVKPPAT